MDKFEQIIPKIVEFCSKERDIIAVFLYGSVARGDYSLRHSDLDLFIMLDRKNKNLENKITNNLRQLGVQYNVDVHIEFQTKKIRQKDQTLFRKIIEEGRIIHSKGFMFYDSISFGLKPYSIIKYSTKDVDQNSKTKLTQILNGRLIGKKRNKGIIDNININSLGRGAIMVANEKIEDIKMIFKRLDIRYEIERMIYL